MDKNYSLRYFIEIFGDEKSAYLELLETLIESLGEWRSSYGPALLSRDPMKFSFHRHKAITLMENLELHTLLALSEEAKALLASGASLESLKANIQAAEAQIDQAMEGLKDDLAQV